MSVTGTRRRVLGVAAVSALMGSVASGAEPVPATQQFDYHHGDVLGTSLDLVVIAPTRAEADAAENVVLAEVERLRKILSTYDNQAQLARVNASPVNGPGVAVSGELIDVLKQYEHWSKQSRKAYSANVGALVTMWKEAETAGKLPADAELLAAAKGASQLAWEIDPTKKTVRRIADQQINVDSLGKGFIVGKAVAAATREPGKIKGLLLNIGGDIRVWGEPAPGKPWKIGVQDPAHPELNAKPLATVHVSGDRAVATSGAYQRFYTIEGKRYSHILDARTGKPGRNTAATVIAPDSATANALATLCCILKPGEAFELVNAIPDAACLIITADETQMRTDAFKAYESGSVGSTATGPKLPSEFPSGFKVAIDLETLPTQHKPYVFVWITDAAGKHVKTLGAFGNETKYLREMREWWKVARNDRVLQGITRATKQAGKYPLSWDGTDQRGSGVPLGSYSVWVEVSSEHGPYAAKSASITLSKQAAKAVIGETSAFKEVTITFGPGGK